jgi:DNA-binding CsgD family transcriptional regulator
VQPIQLNHRERRLATQLLTAQGLSLREIAARLAINPRTVSRYRRNIAGRNDLRERPAPTLAPNSGTAGPHRRVNRPAPGGVHGPRSSRNPPASIRPPRPLTRGIAGA